MSFKMQMTLERKDLKKVQRYQKQIMTKYVQNIMQVTAQKVVTDLKKSVPSSPPRKRKLKRTGNFPRQYLRYGTLKKNLKRTSTVNSGWQKRRGYFAKRHFVDRRDAYWIRFIDGGTTTRRTRKGVNRGRMTGHSYTHRSVRKYRDFLHRGIDEAVRESFKQSIQRSKTLKTVYGVK